MIVINDLNIEGKISRNEDVSRSSFSFETSRITIIINLSAQK